MRYSDKLRAVYIAPPKTGTRSISNLLQKNYDFIRNEDWQEHLDEVPKELKNYYSFISVRNPYDRAVSSWWFHFKRGEQRKPLAGWFNFIKETDGSLTGFLKWLINNRYKVKDKERGYRFILTQADYLKENKIDKIIYLEDVQNGINSLPFVKDIEVEIPKLNVAANFINPKNQKTFDYITQYDLDLINEYYKEDFELLTRYKVIHNLNK